MPNYSGKRRHSSGRPGNSLPWTARRGDAFSLYRVAFLGDGQTGRTFQWTAIYFAAVLFVCFFLLDNGRFVARTSPLRPYSRARARAASDAAGISDLPVDNLLQREEWLPINVFPSVFHVPK